MNFRDYINASSTNASGKPPAKEPEKPKQKVEESVSTSSIDVLTARIAKLEEAVSGLVASGKVDVSKIDVKPVAESASDPFEFHASAILDGMNDEAPKVESAQQPGFARDVTASHGENANHACQLL